MIKNPATAPKSIKEKARSRLGSRANSKGMSKAEQRAQSQEQILDGAERLLSRRGLYGVTLKEVAQEVGVHTSLLHYYFEDKRDLFDHVIARRAPETIKRRMDALTNYEQMAGDNPTVEGALHAFLDPDLDIYGSGDEGWRNYGAIAGHVVNTPMWGSEKMNMFDPVVMRLISLLKKAMPEISEEDIYWGYQFVSAALIHTVSRTGRIDRLSNGMCQTDDLEAAKARMAKFMASGFMAFCKDQA